MSIYIKSEVEICENCLRPVEAGQDCRCVSYCEICGKSFYILEQAIACCMPGDEFLLIEENILSI